MDPILGQTTVHGLSWKQYAMGGIEEYEHLHDWMVGWDLLEPDSDYDAIIGRQIAASA